MSLDKGSKLCAGLVRFDLLPEFDFRHELLLLLSNDLLTSRDDILHGLNRFLPLLSLGLDHILIFHQTEQELFERLSLLFKLIQFVEPFLIRLWLLDQLFLWDLLSQLDSLLLFVLLL